MSLRDRPEAITYSQIMQSMKNETKQLSTPP